MPRNISCTGEPISMGIEDRSGIADRACRVRPRWSERSIKKATTWRYCSSLDTVSFLHATMPMFLAYHRRSAKIRIHFPPGPVRSQPEWTTNIIPHEDPCTKRRRQGDSGQGAGHRQTQTLENPLLDRHWRPPLPLCDSS